MNIVFRSPLTPCKLLRNYARYIDKNTINLNQDTLTGRLLIYLRNQKTESYIKTGDVSKIDQLLNILKKKPETFTKLPKNELTRIICSLEDKNVIESDKDVVKILKMMDIECSLHYKSLDPSEILNILDSYMNFMPNRITNLKFYQLAMQDLSFRCEELDRADLMKLIFFIGLMKKNDKPQKMLKNLLKLLKSEDINNLSCEELCIIANSTFKTSTKISNKEILDKILNYLNDNLTLLRDPAVFVTLIKSLRQNRYYNEDILATISCAMFFNKTFTNYTFQTYCHLLALYSDSLYYDENSLNFFTTKCINELKNYERTIKNGIHEIRTKDLLRFLWGLSNLNYCLSKEDIKNVIIPKILENKSELNYDSVINIILYLWMLNYKPYELIPIFIENKKEINGSNTRQRLNTLLTLIFHEDRILFKKLSMRPQGQPNFIEEEHLKIRPVLQRVYNSLKSISSKLDMRIETEYQIPNINILGIGGYQKNIYKTVNIEVLDDFTTLKNTNCKPTGLMQVKLRILDGLEEGLIVLKENEVEHLTEAELENLLYEEVNLVS